MNIYQAIATVSAEVGALVADGHNRDQNYRYITADKVLERAGGAMAKAGLVVIPAVKHEATEQITYTSFGKEKTRYDSTVEFDMTIATADGEPVVMHWIGRGSDYAVPDKALYKAITSGHKYFLMKLFNIGVGNEDGEHENPPAEPQNQRQGRATPRQATNGQPPPETPADGENTPLDAGRIADLRATIDGSGETVKVGFVLDRLVTAGLYSHVNHALNAAKQWDGWPDGYTVKISNVIKTANGLRLYDWLVERKAEASA